MSHVGRATIRGFFTNDENHLENYRDGPRTIRGGIPGPMAVEQMKASDLAALGCPGVRVDTKRPSLDTIPRRQVPPFLEKVKSFLLGAFM